MRNLLRARPILDLANRHVPFHLAAGSSAGRIRVITGSFVISRAAKLGVIVTKWPPLFTVLRQRLPTFHSSCRFRSFC
jgi:hypothetical protein